MFLVFFKCFEALAIGQELCSFDTFWNFQQRHPGLSTTPPPPQTPPTFVNYRIIKNKK